MFLRMEFLKEQPSYGIIQMQANPEDFPCLVTSVTSILEVTSNKNNTVRTSWSPIDPEKNLYRLIDHVLPNLKTFPGIKEACSYLGIPQNRSLIFTSQDIPIPKELFLISSKELDRNGFMFVTQKGYSGFLVKNPESRLALCYSNNTSKP
jgi:hypothetical protein